MAALADFGLIRAARDMRDRSRDRSTCPAPCYNQASTGMVVGRYFRTEYFVPGGMLLEAEVSTVSVTRCTGAVGRSFSGP
jgi:hypothetical protein